MSRHFATGFFTSQGEPTKASFAPKKHDLLKLDMSSLYNLVTDLNASAKKGTKQISDKTQLIEVQEYVVKNFENQVKVDNLSYYIQNFKMFKLISNELAVKIVNFINANVNKIELTNLVIALKMLQEVP